MKSKIYTKKLRMKIGRVWLFQNSTLSMVKQGVYIGELKVRVARVLEGSRSIFTAIQSLSLSWCCHPTQIYPLDWALSIFHISSTNQRAQRCHVEGMMSTSSDKSDLLEGLNLVLRILVKVGGCRVIPWRRHTVKCACVFFLLLFDLLSGYWPGNNNRVGLDRVLVLLAGRVIIIVEVGL
jgi:hypothetical protein